MKRFTVNLPEHPDLDNKLDARAKKRKDLNMKGEPNIGLYMRNLILEDLGYKK